MARLLAIYLMVIPDSYVENWLIECGARQRLPSLYFVARVFISYPRILDNLSLGFACKILSRIKWNLRTKIVPYHLSECRTESVKSFVFEL